MSSSTQISPKTTASAGGGGLGIALSVILVWILSANGVDVPEPVATAIGAVITAALASAGAYFKRDELRDKGQIVAGDGAGEDV